MKIRISENKIGNIFCILASMVFFTLLYYSLSLTGIHSHEQWDEHIYFRQDFLLFNCFLLLLAIVAFCIFGKIYEKYISKVNRNLILALFCFASLAISLFWVAEVKSMPEADQSLVCQYANAFNMGDFRGFNKGIYVSVNSWQLGMISLLRIIFNIFGYDNWRAFQYLSACFVPLIIFSGCKIVRLTTNDDGKIEWYYLLFSITCFPMYAYTVFVYGEIISTALAMTAVWLMLSCFKKFSWHKALVMGLLIGIAVQLRKNVLIIVVALIITIIVKLLGKWNWRILVTGIFILASVLTVHFAHWGWYADKIDPEAQSMPASLHIVMGLNDDNSWPGWYNVYNYDTFVIAEFDVDKANELAKEDLKTYINLYKNSPAYFVDFFVRKMNAQWNAPMYQSIRMNDNIEGELSPFISDIFTGQRIGKVLDWGMKVYQLVLYGGILFWLMISMKKQKEIEQYVLLIAVYGGFLFSLIWEAKTRYVFPYLLLMLPYGAMGVHAINNMLGEMIKNRKSKHILSK